MAKRKIQQTPDIRHLKKGEVRKIVAELQRITESLTRKDLGDWRNAWQLAINVENPSRQRLYDIYRDVAIDLHLSGCIGQREGFVLSRSFKLCDKDGKENAEATELLNAEWFKQLVKYTLEANYWGHSLIELDWAAIASPTGGREGATLIPRKHVIPEYHRVIRDLGDDWRRGIDYHERPFIDNLIEVGQPDSLGLYLKAATQTIPKKNALAFWDTFAEIFGMPMRIARTTSRDDKEYQRLEKMLKEAGYAGYMVAQQGTELEVVESSKSDAFNVYDKRIDRANSELSKLVIGQTMTIEDGSSLSQSETHLKVFDNIVEADCDMIRDMVNSQLLPRMEQHGMAVGGLRFDWDYSIDYTPEQQRSYEELILNNYEVEPEYFAEKYNIPVGPRRNPLDPSTPPTPPTEKKKLTLEAQSPQSAHLAQGEQRLSRLFRRLMRALFAEHGASLRIGIIAEQPAQDFIAEHAAILDNSFEQVRMSDTMRSALSRSNYIFSGFKTFHELHEASALLIDSNGNRKPFEQFLNDVRKINETYNRNYLRAEYNFCHSSAQMAAKWDEFQADGDEYNLQYRTAADGRVRPEHAALHGVTLPPSDPFWREYFPPNGWNCRCNVVQVLRDKYPTTPHDEAMQRGAEATGKDTKGIFRFNPGIERKSFPDYNPYTIPRCRDCDIAKGNLKLARPSIPEYKKCEVCLMVRTGLENQGETYKVGDGAVTIHRLVNRNDSDFEGLKSIAEFFARENGDSVILTPKMSRPPKFQYECVYSSLVGTKYEGKCPDIKVTKKSGDIIWYEYEGFKTDNPKRAFQNMLKHGLRQSNRIVIEKPNLTDAYMKRVIRQRVKDGQNIEEVWIKDGNQYRNIYKKFEE